MRRMRFFSIILFIVSIVVFGVYTIFVWVTQDHVGPRIIISDETLTVSATADEEVLLEGIRAVDKKDGDVTDSLMVESLGHFIEKGRRKMTIAAFDSDNHVTKISKEIIYNDYHSPRFGLNAPLRFPVDTQNILSGMSAEDILDGNLTANIKISSDYSLKVSTPGEYPMLFTVSNSAGDVSELPATVQIYDPEEEARCPQIRLSSYLVYTTPGQALEPWDYLQEIQVGGKEFEKGTDGLLHELHAVDGQAQTIGQNEVQITQDFDYGIPGVYEILYQYISSDDRLGSVRLVVVVSE